MRRHAETTAPKNDTRRTIIELRNVTKTFFMKGLSTTVLHGISLCIRQGDFMALTGSSGSGKSTLLHIMGLLEQPTEGEYLLAGRSVQSLDDKDLSALRNQVLGFVFQNFFLIPYATALENVLLPGTYSNRSGTELRDRAEYLLEKVGLADRMDFTPSRLSGGQQQRVALARALLGEPDILLADEPTGQLDSTTSRSILDLFSRINKEGTTIVVVTHGEETASCAKTRLEMHDGCIQAPQREHA
ncbi:MAG: ABC transporter ATP-binding protein [Desulfovibrio sp.]|uniref:ABC transporter ATP-binding protein n=1 Tax=Desulfovibrio sp. 7SRBS1 TaxID=3378064 RepID=UPI003B3FFF41